MAAQNTQCCITAAESQLRQCCDSANTETLTLNQLFQLLYASTHTFIMKTHNKKSRDESNPPDLIQNPMVGSASGITCTASER